MIKRALVLIFLIGLLVAGSAHAKSLDEITSEIAKYQAELDRLSVQAKSLNDEIARYNTQIKLTELKISQTEEKIALLGGRIDQLETSLDSLSEAFSRRAAETYKMTRMGNSVVMLVTANDLADAVSRYHYLQRILESDRQLLLKLQQSQSEYKNEKVDQETLSAQLTKQKADLDSQKKAKNDLLIQTKNDERKYQDLLSRALAEKSAIERALVTGVKVGPVAQGEPIGLVGNSGYPGCSTGKHLHLEVRKNGSWVDPTAYLASKTVKDEQEGGGMVSMGSGGWPWPISDTIRLTQHYGHTPYSWVYKYSGGIHTGLDMVSTSSDVIRAPASGTLYKSSEACGSSSVINVIYIDHGDDLISFYLHVQ